MIKPTKTPNERKTIAYYLVCMSSQLVLLYDLASMTKGLASDEPNPLIEAVTLDGDLEETICAAEHELINFLLKQLPTADLNEDDTIPLDLH